MTSRLGLSALIAIAVLALSACGGSSGGNLDGVGFGGHDRLGELELLVDRQPERLRQRRHGRRECQLHRRIG